MPVIKTHDKLQCFWHWHKTISPGSASTRRNPPCNCAAVISNIINKSSRLKRKKSIVIVTNIPVINSKAAGNHVLTTLCGFFTNKSTSKFLRHFNGGSPMTQKSPLLSWHGDSGMTRDRPKLILQINFSQQQQIPSLLHRFYKKHTSTQICPSWTTHRHGRSQEAKRGCGDLTKWSAAKWLYHPSRSKCANTSATAREHLPLLPKHNR